MKDPFRPEENPAAVLALAKARVEDRLWVKVPEDLDPSFFRDLVVDSSARFARGEHNGNMEMIFDAVLWAHKCCLEPHRTAYKIALGLLFGARARAKRHQRSLRPIHA